MKIKQKLIGSFMIVATICLIIGLIGWIGISNVNNSMLEIGNERLPAVKALLTLDATIGDIATAQMELLNPKISIEESSE